MSSGNFIITNPVKGDPKEFEIFCSFRSMGPIAVHAQAWADQKKRKNLKVIKYCLLYI